MFNKTKKKPTFGRMVREGIIAVLFFLVFLYLLFMAIYPYYKHGQDISNVYLLIIGLVYLSTRNKFKRLGKTIVEYDIMEEIVADVEQKEGLNHTYKNGYSKEYAEYLSAEHKNGSELILQRSTARFPEDYRKMTYHEFVNVAKVSKSFQIKWIPNFDENKA